MSCCNDKAASQMRDYAKAKVKALGLSGEGKTRVDQTDIDEIIEEHLQHGRVVERLKM